MQEHIENKNIYILYIQLTLYITKSALTEEEYFLYFFLDVSPLLRLVAN
jgi:hypothetical protein